jgi:hypothetical protein
MMTVVCPWYAIERCAGADGFACVAEPSWLAVDGACGVEVAT